MIQIFTLTNSFNTEPRVEFHKSSSFPLTQSLKAYFIFILPYKFKTWKSSHSFRFAHQNSMWYLLFPPKCGIRTRNLSRRTAADARLRPRGHWDRHSSTVLGLYDTSLRYLYPVLGVHGSSRVLLPMVHWKFLST